MEFILKQVKTSLENKGFKISDEDYLFEDKSVLDFKINNDFIVRIIESKNKNEKRNYSVDIALIDYFDRWANSGYINFFDSYTEVIEYLSNEEEWITSALSELIIDIVEECKFNNDYKDLYEITNKMIEILRKEN